MKQTHIIVGTAGHVDHGKTRLTIALTGIDTDRLPEEKRRGLTIVPGYAYVDLKSGRRLGVVDVPGHEQFIKNMLSGVAGIDMALLVVAADEGVMPQTIEHLNILHLLGIDKGVVAITKTDLVEKEWLDLIVEDVEKLLSDTTLKEAPIMPVSAHTGYQIEELKELLNRVAATVRERSSTGLCRLPVDRVFHKPGFGTVITGTLWAGQIGHGQVLELLPGGTEYRVRGIQVHDQPVEEAQAGQRTALNLTGAKTDKIQPGCWLATPKFLQETHRVDVELTLLKEADDLTRHKQIRIFHGTKEVLGRIRLLDREVLKQGENCLCQLELNTPLVPVRGDRMIIRAYATMVTIAGALVLDAHPPRYKISDPHTMETIQRKAHSEEGQSFLSMLEGSDTLLSLREMAEVVQLSPEETQEKVEKMREQLKVVNLDGVAFYYPVALDAKWRNILKLALEEYHASYPLRRGMPGSELKQLLPKKLMLKQFNALLATYAQEGLLKILSDGLVAKKYFTVTPTPKQQAELAAILRFYQDKLFSPPEWDGLLPRLHILPDMSHEYLGWLLDNQKLEKIGPVFFTYGTLSHAQQLLRTNYPREFTIAQARDLLHTSRKYAQLLLDALDAAGITKRNNDVRKWEVLL